MKLSARAYAILWDGHAWAGAISSIILFAVFFLGAFSLFAEELEPWQEPTFRAAGYAPESEAIQQRALELAQAELELQVAKKPSWFGLSLPTEEAPWIRLWGPGEDGAPVTTFLHPETGERFDQRSDLGDFLVRLHYLEPFPQGMIISGLASIVLLFLAGTGLLLQLGRLVREFFQFRPRSRQRRVLWSDAHKVVGVISLPYVIVFALTGALFCLSDLFTAPLADVAYDGDTHALAVAEDWPLPPAPTGEPGGAIDLKAALATAQARFPDAHHHWFFFDNLGDTAAVVDMPGEREGTITAYTNVRLNLDGDVIWDRTYDDPADVPFLIAGLYGLHLAGWASFGVKVLYAVLALLVSFGILAGNLIWLERRRARGLGRFDLLLERITVGACAGLPAAVGVLFLANQLLPADLADRPSWEHAAFYVAWGITIALPFALRRPARIARWFLVAGAALFALVPLVDAVRAARIPLDPGIPWLLATDATLLLTGALLGLAALVVYRLEQRPAAARPAERVDDAPRLAA